MSFGRQADLRCFSRCFFASIEGIEGLFKGVMVACLLKHSLKGTSKVAQCICSIWVVTRCDSHSFFGSADGLSQVVEVTVSSGRAFFLKRLRKLSGLVRSPSGSRLS